ncbi:MAG: type II toxin-antitoxin system RelE/ParE family toxin [Gallionella sp.]|nr:type II toxin-antitoxin system RelE/ParE family toxin [Gallionella sp.]
MLKSGLMQYHYIALENTVAAQKVALHLLESAISLVDFPEVGHAGKREGTRELVLSRYPYTLIYKFRAQQGLLSLPWCIKAKRIKP